MSGPAGNLYDKGGTRNPVARRLIERFDTTVDRLLEAGPRGSVLDVGCGEGSAAQRWALRDDVSQVVGVDVEDAGLRAQWALRTAPGLSLRVFDGGALPFEDTSFDVVCALEVLEHVAAPEALLGEMVRCARAALIVSVPREPLWRALNLARFSYVRSLGNTPGHVQHWTTRGFEAFVGSQASVVAVESRLPWTIVRAEV